MLIRLKELRKGRHGLVVKLEYGGSCVTTRPLASTGMNAASGLPRHPALNCSAVLWLLACAAWFCRLGNE